MPCYSTHMPHGPALEIVLVPVELAGTRWSMVMMMRVAARGNSMGWRGRARISTD